MKWPLFKEFRKDPKYKKIIGGIFKELNNSKKKK